MKSTLFFLCTLSLISSSVRALLHGFSPRLVTRRSLTAFSAPADKHLPTNRINHNVDLANPKVADFIEVKPGEKFVACRCWLSGKWPACDGSHVEHNKRTGDNVGPAVITGAKEK